VERRDSKPMKHIDFSYFIYDGDCAFCLRMTNLIAGSTPGFQILASQNAKVLLLQNSIPFDVTENEAIWISSEGDTKYGPCAISAALKQGNLQRRCLGRIIDSYPLRKPARVVYARIAKKRRIFGWKDTNCTLDGSRPEYPSTLFQNGLISIYILFQFMLPFALFMLRCPPINRTFLYGWGWQMFS
jgi:predicted DCC family thiol-disulfide oxidoreductase YuxK